MEIEEVKKNGIAVVSSMIIRAEDWVVVLMPNGQTYPVEKIMTNDARDPGGPDGPGRTFHHLMLREESYYQQAQREEAEAEAEDEADE